MPQSATEVFSLTAQQMMMDIILHREQNEKVDVKKLQKSVNEYAQKVSNTEDDQQFDAAVKELKKVAVLEVVK